MQAIPMNHTGRHNKKPTKRQLKLMSAEAGAAARRCATEAPAEKPLGLKAGATTSIFMATPRRDLHFRPLHVLSRKTWRGLRARRHLGSVIEIRDAVTIGLG